MKRGIKILSFLVLSTLAVPLNVFAESSMTWRTDIQWQPWDRDHVAPVGGDQGIQLTKDATGQFYSTGTAQFEYSVGSTTKWKNFSADFTNSSPVSRQFLWIAIDEADIVSQIDPRTGSVVKDWAVGDDPSRTAVGCHNDAWVANRTGNSVSHMQPSSNSVKTISVGSPLAALRAISLQCSSAAGQPDYIWVAGNGYVIKIDADKFDALSSTSQVIGSDAQIGSTIDSWSALYAINSVDALSAGRGYMNYGSVFGGPGTNRYLYIGYYTAAKNPPIFRVDTTNHIVDSTFVNGSNLVRGGFYAMNNDSRGNVWRDGGCIRIMPDGTVNNLDCADNTVGISVKRIDNQKDRVLYVSNATRICSFELRKAHTDNPIKGDVTCTANGTARNGALGYDVEGNVWNVPRAQPGGVIKFTASSGYQTRQVFPFSNAAWTPYTYSDFIGNALENSFGALTFSFSPDGGTNWFSQADLEAGTIPDSASLKIKATFTGASTSPVLKSITLGYETQFGNLGSKMTKSTYRTAEDRNAEKNPKSTFEKGETVYVRIKTFEGVDGRTNLLLTDRISNVENPSNLTTKKFVYKDGAKCANLNGSVVARYLSDTGDTNHRYEFTYPTIKQGENCIDYEYKVIDEQI